MKKLLLLSMLAVLFLALASCKSRQVSLQVAKTEDHSTSVEVKKQSSLHIDTGKSFTDFKSSLMLRDSFAVEIITDTGIVRIVNGSFTGRAKSVIIKGTHLENRDSSAIIQENKGQIIYDTLNDSTKNQTDIVTSTKNKETKTKPDYSWIFWVVGIGILLVIGVGIYNALKPKPKP